MSTRETFSGLTGAGDITFTLSGVVERVRVDVTNTGNANQIDQSVTFPRFFKLGWWSFIDDTFGLGQAALSPFYFVDFEHTWYTAPDGVNFFPGGFAGIHFNLYPGVVADFNVLET